MRHRIGLYLSANPLDGGVYQYNLSVLDAVASLSTDKFSTIVAYTNDTWKKELSTFELRGVFVPPSVWTRALGRLVRDRILPVPILRSFSRAVHPVIRRLQNESCDLWIFPSQNPISYHGKLPSLVPIHDLMHRYEKRFPEVSSNGQFEWREMHYRNICRFAKAVLIDSHVGKKHVMESYGLEDERTHILPYVAPRYVFRRAPDNGFDRRYHLPKKFIFYPAQFWEHKNHENLVRAIHILKPKVPDLQLVLVGGKTHNYEPVLNLVTNLQLHDCIHMVGYVLDEDITEFYRRAVALVFPTFFGPTNIPPLEAFALGCPCAVSDIYGMGAQVGDAALLFDPERPESIASAIQKLWLNGRLRRRLAQKGKAKANLWNQLHFNRRFQEIVEKVLSS